MSAPKRARLEPAAPPTALPSVATPAETLHDARAAVSTLGRTCARLPIRFAASVDALNKSITSAGEDIADWARVALFDFRSLVRGRVKALEALVEAGEVSRKQLDALALMCEGAVSSGDAEAVEAALAACETMWPLLEARVAPMEEAFCAMDGGYDDALQEAGEWGRVASGASVACEGKGLTRFSVAGGDNAFQLVCRDDAGVVLESVCSVDVDVAVEGGTVVICDVVAPGIVEVCYGVDSGVTAITVHVGAFGSSVAGSPWSVRGGLANKCVQEISVGSVVALAVSPDGSLLAVCDRDANEVHMYSLPDGAITRVLTDEDVSVDSYMNFLMGVCFSADGANILVADEEAVHEATITGTPLRKFRVEYGCEPGYSSVTTDGTVVVACSEEDSELFVFDYATTAVLHRIDTYGSSVGDITSFSACRGVELTADKHILVADFRNNVVLKFTLDCVYVETVFSKDDTVPMSVTETAAEEIIFTQDHSNPHLLGPGRDEFLVTPPGIAEFEEVTAVTSRGRLVYVLDEVLASVFVYE